MFGQVIFPSPNRSAVSFVFKIPSFIPSVTTNIKVRTYLICTCNRITLKWKYSQHHAHLPKICLRQWTTFGGITDKIYRALSWTLWESPRHTKGWDLTTTADSQCWEVEDLSASPETSCLARNQSVYYCFHKGHTPSYNVTSHYFTPAFTPNHQTGWCSG